MVKSEPPRGALGLRIACAVLGSLILLLGPAERASSNDAAARAMRIGDYAAAARALRAASLAGDADSQYQLGALYRSGRGVEKDHAEALRWFTAAARQGHSKAQYHTGLFHENGWGTKRAPDKALHWLKLSAEQGHARARTRVQDIEGQRSASGLPAATPVELDSTELEAALWRAVRKGDSARVKALTRGGAKLPPQTAGKRTLVHEAVDTRAPDIIRTLGRAGVPTNRPDRFGETPLMRAARTESLDCISALHDTGVDLDQRDAGGRTALMIAAQHGRMNAVRLLIKLGARADLLDRQGFNAARLASRAGHDAVAKRLPRGAAAPSNTSDLAARRGWIEQTVSSQGSEYSGWPPLTIAALQGDTELVKELANAGADLEQRDPAGQTALMRASSRGRARGVAALLKAGAGTGAPDGEASPICLASRAGHTEVIELLLEYGASPRAGSPADSPLMHALEGGHPAGALRLLEAGAAPESGTPVWFSALELAAQRGEDQIVAVLASRRHKPIQPIRPQHLSKAACQASDSGSTESMRLILALGAEATTQCDDGLPLLARFSTSDPTRMLRLLTASGADVEQASASGNSALQLAAHAGRTDVVTALLDAGADVDRRGQGRSTALMAASQAGQLDAVELLLERGADAGDRNQKGQTARQLAEFSGHTDVVEAIDEHARGSRWFGSR